ncbi:MAG: SUKH-3 domain-containing protein [Ruminococcus sp.]|nr:SUKH-3 domain-containing protein [Ruminococcus sp.]
MTREEFEKFKEIHNIEKYECDLEKFLKEAEEWSVRNNCSEQFKKAEMNNIIDFIKEYGRFYFKRTEKKSGDVIKFSCSVSESCHYWKDVNQVAFRIGEFENSSGDIERLYMLEDGSFYNYHRKKIADNTPDFLDYITTVEYDYHAPISENTYRKLKEAGWYEGRKIDISGLVKECEKDGVFLTEPQKRFIEEFGGLEGSREDISHWFYISDKRTTEHSEGKPVYFIDMLNYTSEDMKGHAILFNAKEENIINIIEKYGENTVCVGGYGDWCTDILLAENGLMVLQCEGHIEEYGRTAMEGFNKMFW